MEIQFYGEESLLEAKMLNTTPYVKAKRERVSLPYNPNDRLKGYMVFTLNTSIDRIAMLLRGEHNVIFNIGNIYKIYYYDYMTLRGSLKGTTITTPGITLKEAKQQRLVRYGSMKAKMDGVITPIRLDLARNKNMIYDLQPVAEFMKGIPKVSKRGIMEKLTTFFQTIYGHYSRNFDGYTKGPILVDLDEIKPNMTLNDYHVITYLLTLFTRSDSALAAFRIPMEFFFYSSKGYVRFDMKTDLVKANLSMFRGAIKKLQPKISDEIEDAVIKEEIMNSFNSKMGFTGDMALSPDDEIADTLKSTIRKDLDEEEEEDTPEDEVELIDDIEKEVEENPELKEGLVKALTKKKGGSASQASLKRDALLREKQRDIVVKTKTIGQLKEQIDVPDLKMEEFKVPEVINPEIAQVKFDNFEKTYNETLLEKDLASAFTAFNDKTINVNVTNVEVKDSSDVMSLKETYTVSLEDENRKRHTIKVNIPKFVDDQFLYLNGNKRLIKKQLLSLPVVKTKEDEVQICSAAYNKIFIRRTGSRFNPNMEKFKKLILDGNYGIQVKKGNNISANTGNLTCLEYDEMASHYTEIAIGNCHFVFNVNLLQEELGHKYESSLGKYLIGYKVEGTKKIPLYYDNKNEEHVDLISTMILESKPEMYDDFKAKGFGKKYIYTYAVLMKKKIPVIVLLCFFEGLSTVIKKFGDDSVTFVDKESNRDNYMYIPFKNGFLQYPMSNIEACILFNGLTEVPTAQYDISQFDERETFIDVFEYLYGSAYIMGGFLNFYDFMIDPITLEVLQTLSLPEDLVSLMIYADNLLADNQVDCELAMQHFRLRNNEVVAAVLYKELTRAYSKYRNTRNSKNQTKLTVDPDCVIKALNDIPTISDYSTLSPILEYRELHTASMKGYVGMNLADAYTPQRRIYHDSMIGIVGASTDIADNTGQERHLVIEPNVKNARGMFDVTDKKDVDKLDYTKLSTGIEALVPFGARHDDERRTAMAVKQRGHLIPVKDQSPLLITNGMDSMIHYRTGDDFSVVAKENGKVIEYDDVAKVMIVEYTSGKRKAIDLSLREVKNGGGGIYLRNQMITSFKKGDSFKRGDIIAFDKYFYKDTGPFGNRLSIGVLAKTALVTHTAEYEDSTLFSPKLSRKLATDITMPVSVIIGKNATVEFIVKPGDHVKIGDPLVRFETSYDHDELNVLLGNIRSDLQEEIINFGKTNIVSHYAGVVDKVEVYSAVDFDQLSPSLQKIANDAVKEARARKKLLNKYDNEKTSEYYKIGMMLNSPDGKVEPDRYGKIGGADVGDGVLVKFFVTYHDELGDGDKIVHMTANKATGGFLIPHGYEPRTEYRPYEEISIYCAASAVLQRGTPTVVRDMVIYKLLIEAKRKMYEILTGEDWNEKDKRENPYMVIDDEPLEESLNLPGATLTSKKVVSETLYAPGDVVAVGEPATSLYQHLFETDDLVCYKDSNLRYDAVEEVVYATDTIYPGEVFRVDF